MKLVLDFFKRFSFRFGNITKNEEVRKNTKYGKQTKQKVKRNKQAKLNEQLLCIIYLQNENTSTKNKQDHLNYLFNDCLIPFEERKDNKIIF